MKNKKGFTIVELVIVIAVIAILAAVLIPTFSGVIGKANTSARTQEFTNALKVVLAGNAETGALAENTIFVSSDEYFSVYNGNKLGNIEAFSVKDESSTVDLIATTAPTQADTSSVVTFKKDKSDNSGTPVTIQSVILPFVDGQPTSDSLKAVAKFFGSETAAQYSNNKITISFSGNITLTLNCYSNLDIAKGMFVLSPTA